MAEPRTYKLISADGHLNGPGDIWTKRVAQKYLDQVPAGRALPSRATAGSARGSSRAASAGRRAPAGRPTQQGEWCRYEDIHPGGYDPKARVQEQIADGVDAELLFPMGFASGYVKGTKDPDLHLEMVRAYNDFLSEFCSYAPDRFVGAAMIPNRGVDQALAEIKRCQDLPGLGAWLLNCYPHGTHRDERRGRAGLGADRGDRQAAHDPHRPHRPAAERPDVGARAARHRPLLRRAPADARVGVQRRPRPSPEPEDHPGRGRLRLDAVLRRAGRRQLPAPLVLRPQGRQAAAAAERVHGASTSTRRSSPTTTPSPTATGSASTG